MKNILFFLLLLSGIIFPHFVFAANFKIVEVMPNTVSDSELEYVSIKNISKSPQSLSGYILKDKVKSYTFSENLFIEKEIIQFFRPQTKIALNNSDEVLELYDASGSLVDSISWESSEKGLFLSFPEEENQEDDEYEQGVISEEALISDEVSPLEPEISSSGSMMIPEIIFSFQRPSYVFPGEEENTYMCDEEKGECKINFDLRPSFSGDFPEKNYVCEIDFGFGLITGEETKCNPNTVTFPKGNFEISIKILSKEDPKSFIKKVLFLKNPEKIILENEVPNSNSGAGSTSESSDENISLLPAPEIQINLQRPSHIIEIAENQYVCSSSDGICKVNFDFRESFSLENPEKDYVCEIDFGFGYLTGEELKCNPNTVEFPLGVSQVQVKIIHKNAPSILSQRVFSVENTGQKQSIVENSEAKLSLYMPRIEVQSGLEGSGRFFTCKGNPCRINLNYPKRNSAERCLWNFGGGKADNLQTRKRCNPGYITLPEGTHTLSLTVYENGAEWNRKKFTFYIENTGENLLSEGVLSLGENEVSDIRNQDLDVSIVLQGKISKNKILSGPMLECYEVEKCFVNFDAELSEKMKGVEYIWFVNGEVFARRQNPAGIWLSEGMHEIDFEVWKEGMLQASTEFAVFITQEKLQKDGIGNDIKNNDSESVEEFFIEDFQGLALGDILPNPIGKDYKEFIEIKNTSGQDRSLYGCYLQDASKKKYKFSETELLKAGETKKYFRITTNITLGNSGESVSLFCASAELSEKKWETKTGEGVSILGISYPVFSSEDLIFQLSGEEYSLYAQKNFSLSARILKYDGLKITGETFPYARVIISHSGGELVTLSANAQGKYEWITKNIPVGNYVFDAQILDTLGNTFFFAGKKELSISQVQKTQWFTAKKSKKPKKLKSPKLPTLKLEMLEIYDAKQEESIGIPKSRATMLIFLILLLALILGLHILSLFSRSPVNTISIFMQIIGTRQKVNILLG